MQFEVNVHMWHHISVTWSNLGFLLQILKKLGEKKLPNFEGVYLVKAKCRFTLLLPLTRHIYIYIYIYIYIWKNVLANFVMG